MIEEEIDSETIIPDQQEIDQQEQNQQNQSSSGVINENNQILNEVRIKIKNAQGEEKELIIRYND